MTPPDFRHTPKRLAVFGSYSDHDLYQRNRILAEIFEELSDSAVYVRPEDHRSGHHFSGRANFFSRVRGLIRDAVSLWRQRSKLRDCDVIFVPYPAYADLLLLWVFGSVKSSFVVADAFLELHSTVVDDRELVPTGSLRARLLKALQRFSLAKADVVLIDTPEQAALLRDELRNTGVKVLDVPVGIDESIWILEPLPEMAECAQLLFWGTFIPLHGVEVIIAAARILEDRVAPVAIHIIGDGQTADEIAADLKATPLQRLTWDRRLVDTQSLRKAISEAHLVLGIFGESMKAGSVVPYKVHQGLASGRPVITRSGSATERLTAREMGLVLCPPGDPEALADAIEVVTSRLREGWTPRPRAVYEANMSRRVIRERLLKTLESTSADSRGALL